MDSPGPGTTNYPQTSGHPAASLVRALLEDGRLSVAQANELLRCRMPAHSQPLSWLAAQEAEDAATPGARLGEGALLHWLSKHSGLPLRQINPLDLDARSVTGAIPAGFAEHHNILALELDAARAIIACADPFRIGEWDAELRRVLQREIMPVLAHPDEICRHRRVLYRLHSAPGTMAPQGERPRVPAPEQGPGDTRALGDWLLRSAVEQRASDIHLEPRRDSAQVRLRIDGALQTICRLPLPTARAVLSRFKVLAAMDVAETRHPQDGRMRFAARTGDDIDLRLSTLPTAFGEKLAVRLLDPQALFRDFSQLGLEDEALREWQSMIGTRHGMLLVTGATGSGKTTTLYTSLRALADGRRNICTVEDPVEIIEPSFNQTQVQREIGLDFAAGIRALLRQDPDVIMVGEIRDAETARTALQAALTGHLVFATLHTEDSLSAVTRLSELGMPDYLLRATLLGIMAQRLARRLCPQCRVAEPVDADAWRCLSQASPPPRVFAAPGCPACRHTGSRGRVGLFELLRVDERLRESIARDADARRLLQAARRRGFRSLREAAAVRVAAGEIALQEALHVI